MPLQIRRGTEAERNLMSQPLAEGELLYVTDTQKIYVGAKNTLGQGILGGIPVTGYTNEEAVDAVGAALVAGSHTGITFTYGVTQDTVGRIDATVNLSNYSGVIKADAFKGSLFADDGSSAPGQPLVDAISGTFNGNLVGNVTGNVSGNLTGNVNGSVTGNIFTNLIDSADSSLITVTPAIRFSSDVTVDNDLIVDNNINIDGSINLTSMSIRGNTILSSIAPPPTTGYLINNPIVFGADDNPNTLIVNSTQQFGVFTGLTDGLVNSGLVARTSRGTLQSPQILQAGDSMWVAQGMGWDGTDYQTAGIFGIGVDQTTTPAAGDVRGAFAVLTIGAGGSQNAMFFDSKGVLTAPVMQPGSFTTAQRNALTPAFGMIIYNTDTNKFQGYQNTGGTTPQWVDLS